MDSSYFKFELVKHFINRKVNQELFQHQKIQTIQKTPQIIPDIIDKNKEKEEKLIYGIMKKELSKEFSDFRYLARGTQGYVMLAKEKQTNKRFAIKGYPVRDEEEELEKKQLQDARQEIEILTQCRGSSYVSNLIKSIDFEENEFLYLVFTEYQGTLQEVIDSTQDKRLNEVSTIKYSKDIAEGLLHIHSKGYLVNDLKMDNILIDYSGNAVVSDFGLAQKLKKNSGYAYNECQQNLYFQAPECVDRELMKIYESEYNKLGVKTQMNPSQRSEACSFGYLIYTMMQGKKNSLKFINEKHKPLEYDDTFMSFKYSNQLQHIIDGLTKFVPKQRLSVQEAFKQLKEIISIKLNQVQKFQIQVSEQTQILSQNQLKGIEFIEHFDKKYYPIVNDEDYFLKELVSEKDPNNKELLEKIKKLQNENKCFQEDKENLKQALNERENQIQCAASQINIKKKKQFVQIFTNLTLRSIIIFIICFLIVFVYSQDPKDIIDLKANLLTKNQEIENLKNNLQYLNYQNLYLLQKQESLQINLQKKDYHNLQIENLLQNQRKEIEELQLIQFDKETQKQYFLENQDKAQEKIQELEEKIKENQDKAQKKIQELEEKIKQNQDRAKIEIKDQSQQIQQQNQNLDKAQKKIQELEEKIKENQDRAKIEIQDQSKQNQNLDISQKKIQELEEKIKENQDRAKNLILKMNLDKSQKKIQELEEKIKDNQDRAKIEIQDQSQQEEKKFNFLAALALLAAALALLALALLALATKKKKVLEEEKQELENQNREIIKNLNSNQANLENLVKNILNYV